MDRDTPSRLSFLAGNSQWPVWTPDGKNLVFQSEKNAAPGLYWIHSDGSGEAQRLTDAKREERPYLFSPDGKRLAFDQRGNAGSLDIFTASFEGDPVHPRLGKPELFLGTPFNEANPAFSPDGRWLAYTSFESGRYQVYVRAFPDKGGKWQISNSGGQYPMWSRADLFFETGDTRIMAAAYTVKGDSFVAGKPRLWSEKAIGGTANNRNVDLAPDGKRVVALLPATEAKGAPEAQNHVVFLENFFDELRRKVPLGK